MISESMAPAANVASAVKPGSAELARICAAQTPAVTTLAQRKTQAA